MNTAREIADYFLTLPDEDAGDSISNLKLQKLLYYAQGCHLALKGEPLFEERIEAWTHGPVIPAIYRAFKSHGSNPIPCPEGLDFSVYQPEVRQLLDEVYNVFGQFSAWKLRNMTHEEPPYTGTDANDEITHESLLEYFSTIVTP